MDRWGRRGGALGIAVVLAVGVLSGSSARASEPAAPASCPEVAMIAARGSGQADGAGAQLDGTFAALRSALPGVTVELLPVPYPALGAENALLNPAAFTASIDQGVQAMRRQARELADACPSTDLVLAGFSQGAMVTHAALRDAATARRTHAALLMADGFRTRVDRVAYLPIGPVRSRGVVVANARAAAPGPLRMPAKAVGTCLAGDVVCDWSADADLATGLRLHSTGYLDPRVQQAAAAAIAARLG